MAFRKNQEMSGLLRSLILWRHELPEAVEALWHETPDQRHRYLALVAQKCGFTSKERAVIYDLLRLMFREYDDYLESITLELSQMYADLTKHDANARIAKSADYEMAYDCRTLAACHLAANRAIARLRLLPVPVTLPGRRVEDWMHIKPHPNIVSLPAYKDRMFYLAPVKSTRRVGNT